MSSNPFSLNLNNLGADTDNCSMWFIMYLPST
jgi:hypothetical protein